MSAPTDQSDDGEQQNKTREVHGGTKKLQLQMAAHQGSWHLGEEERWDISQGEADLVFTFPEVVARAPAREFFEVP